MRLVASGRPRLFLRAMANGRRFSLIEIIDLVGGTNWRQGKNAAWQLALRGDIDVLQVGNGGQNALYRISTQGLKTLAKADLPKAPRRIEHRVGETMVQRACRTIPNSVFALAML